MSVALLRVLRFRLTLLWAAPPPASTATRSSRTSIARPTNLPRALSHTRSFNRACAPVRGAQTLIRLDELLAAIERLEILPDARELMIAFTG